VMICGSGPEEEILKQLADQLNLEKNIVWLGHYPYKDIPQAIAEMDVLVLPSRALPGKWKEQFGHVLVEAMAMGIPVVGSSSGAIPDVIGNPEQIFQENDEAGLATVLEKIIIDAPWREKLRQYGLDRVSKEFSHEVVAKKMIKLWEGIIGK
jgi:glycosyltransferase involved in cell wall biosynthesis